MDSSDPHVVPNPRGNLLLMRLRRKGGTAIDPVLLAQAEEVVMEMRDGYCARVADEVRALADAVSGVDRLPAAEQKSVILHVLRRAFEIGSEGATFDYPLITEIATHLRAFLDGRTTCDALDGAILAAHVDAMRAVLAEDMRGDGGIGGMQLRTALDALTRKWKAR